MEDPLPIREGSPGIYGYSPAEIYYDNLKVWREIEGYFNIYNRVYYNEKQLMRNE